MESLNIQQKRKLPLGIPNFSEIREKGYVYVDKTDLVWQLANGDKFNYLSRPRRFGKTMLIDTLQCYFEGRKELFEGLKIMQLEKEWKKYPVLRMDMSGSGETERGLRSYLNNTFKRYEALYNVDVTAIDDFGTRFQNIIVAAYKQVGLPTVILVDEYDYPLQHSWKTPDYEACTSIYRSVFTILKLESASLHFVFLTGIAKFTQISMFSALNNLINISFDPNYVTLCGITIQETLDNFQPELKHLAELYKCDVAGVMEKLRAMYDGYHFSHRNMIDVFNPFCLTIALAKSELSNFWVASGATYMLANFIKDIDIRLRDFENCYVDRTTMETSDITNGGPEVFLYQSGYLTIKGAQGMEGLEGGGFYILGFPNREVREALYKTVLPALTLREQGSMVSAQAMLRKYLCECNLPEVMKILKALIADVPYSNKKLASMDMEERYRLIISTILNALGLRVEVEKMLSTGRIDLVAHLSKYIYVIELKLTKNGGLKAAENQIAENKYAEPFKAEGKEVVALAVELDDLGKGLLSWNRVE